MSVLFISFIFFSVIYATAGNPSVFSLDERWVCSVKTSCTACLSLPHCSWCKTEQKCFSNTLPQFEQFCFLDKLVHEDYGFSLENNAKCKCDEEEKQKQCYSPGVSSGVQCSGRGECICGHCVCDPNPDPENPTKKVMGEHCEFDNFSCDNPKCNEGPYHMNQNVTNEEVNEIPEELDTMMREEEIVTEESVTTTTAPGSWFFKW